VTPRSSPSTARPEAPDIAELRRLRITHPELATAVDLQIALVELHRRAQSRLPVPEIPSQQAADAALAQGRPLLRFSDIPLSWSDLHYVLRETANLLRQFDLMEADAHNELTRLARDGDRLDPLIAAWFAASQAHEDAYAASVADAPESPLAPHSQAITLAVRPFVAKCADAVLPRLDLSGWQRGYCPLCGAEPDFAVLTASDDRLLICSRCTGRWPFDPAACPFCGNDDLLKLTTFASRESLYRIAACDACLRYVKAYDERRGTRPLLLAVDTIATLPLDAAAMQKGYLG